MLDANDPPVIVASSFDLNQDSSFPNTVIGTILASDQDAGSTVTFAKQAPDTTALLVTLASTGVVSVANVGTALAFLCFSMVFVEMAPLSLLFFVAHHV